RRASPPAGARPRAVHHGQQGSRVLPLPRLHHRARRHRRQRAAHVRRRPRGGARGDAPLRGGRGRPRRARLHALPLRRVAAGGRDAPAPARARGHHRGAGLGGAARRLRVRTLARHDRRPRPRGGLPMTTLAPDTTPAEATRKDGRVVSIAGPVVDVEFPPDSLPEINYALTMTVELEGRELEITAEVAQHIGESRVRAICMKPTDGLRRGTVVHNTGHGITVPVGNGVLGHVFNVIGEPLDTRGEPVTEGIVARWDIHRPAPKFEDLTPKSEMFETGIKVIDLLAPYVKGGKIGMFGGAGVGKTVVILEMISRVA